MPRPLLPTDDLYARLELTIEATPEAIEVAWRALLKRHHPDVAGSGADADTRAKRINVAHDWLSDPELRARYDRERHPERARRPIRAPGTGGRNGAPAGRPGPAATASPARPVRRRPLDAEEALARHLERIDRLTPDELDRLSLAETPPIAFVASIARFLSPELVAAVESVERRVGERLPRGFRWNPGVRDAAVGFGQELVLGPFLDEHLSGAFRERVRERLTRGWTAAVDQPRYGPNGSVVADAIAALRQLSGPAAASLIGRAVAGGGGAGRGGPPWPRGVRPDEDDALRVSSELARRDAVAAIAATGASLSPAGRRSMERAVHALVLRHAFPAAMFEELVGPWRATFGMKGAPRPSVRADRRPRG